MLVEQHTTNQRILEAQEIMDKQTLNIQPNHMQINNFLLVGWDLVISKV